MALEDKKARRQVERQLSKFNVDTTLTQISVINQVCYFKGRMSRPRGPGGRDVDMDSEISNIEEAVLKISDIREVVFDCRIDS